MNRRGFFSVVAKGAAGLAVVPFLPTILPRNKLAEGGIIDKPVLTIVGEKPMQHVARHFVSQVRKGRVKLR